MSQQQEMPTLEGHLASMPATILQLLGVAPPPHIPGPIEPILNLFRERPIERIVINQISNFGLFEITMAKPEFMISTANCLTLLNTQNPYLLGMYHQMMFGGFEYEPNGFNLLKYMKQNNKATVMVGRDKELKRYDGQTVSIGKQTDMATWIEAAKLINRYDLTWLNFLDFDDIYTNKQKTGASNPEELLDKLIRRSDKWFLSMFKQLRKHGLDRKSVV